MITYLIIGILVASLFYAINVALQLAASTRSGAELALVGTYDCGFEALPDQARTQHALGYYLIALLYVIFDLEIALVLPALVALIPMGSAGSGMMLWLLTVLCLGFIYELRLGIFDCITTSPDA